MTNINVRVTSNSKVGRSLISPGKKYNPWAIPEEIRKHNAMIDRKKKEKKARKLAKANTGIDGIGGKF